jgi:hypothetical protein
MPELTQDQKIIEQLSRYLEAGMVAASAKARGKKEIHREALARMVRARHEAIGLGFVWPYPEWPEEIRTRAPEAGTDEPDGAGV